MNQTVTSTCVGGRRAGATPIPMVDPKATGLLLTPRERQVIESVIATGYCTRAAESLGMSKKTIERHMMNIRDKNCLESNYQLIAAFVAAQPR